MSGSLTKSQYVEAIASNVQPFAEAAEMGLKTPIPTCPGWYMATLVGHVGEVQRFWSHQIRTRAQEMQELPDEAFASCVGLRAWIDSIDSGSPDLEHIPPGLINWQRDGAHELVASFEAIEPDEPVWHWSGDNRAITHMRNQAMEATVHRWDAQNAQGTTSPVDPEIAKDGIDQHFDVQIAAARKWSAFEPGRGERYHFHRTDGEGEWSVTFQGREVDIARAHDKGDIAVRGTAENLFLWLWGRLPDSSLEVFGDSSLLPRYRELVPRG